MIIVKLLGGLGNQMFQYAAGKALALHNHTDLMLDITELEGDTKGAYTKRSYELSCFNVKAAFASVEEINRFMPQNTSRLKRVFNRLLPSISKRIVFYESGHHFHPNFFNLPENTYLSGFWQSEKYFKDFRDKLKIDFSPSNPLPADLISLKEKIQRTESVSIHVRRGDYVALKAANDFHGTCEAVYYEKAVEIIAKKKAVELFIFSDDLEWCKENLKFQFPVNFVDQSHGACWDMYLMSHCKHNIIANSSFSWWGAWLNENAGKIVVAPEYWLRNVKSVSMDIIPEGWKII